MPRKTSGWSTERREKQKAAIRRWAPWLGSTGPITREGKARASQNARKATVNSLVREARRLIREARLSLVNFHQG